MKKYRLVVFTKGTDTFYRVEVFCPATKILWWTIKEKWKTVVHDKLIYESLALYEAVFDDYKKAKDFKTYLENEEAPEVITKIEE